jgi:hypothetical protein
VIFMRYWGSKQGHDAVAQDLIHRPFVAVHSLHHVLQGRIEEFLGNFRIKVTDQFSGAFEVGEQHGHVFALALHGASAGEDLLGQVGRRVGQRSWGRPPRGSDDRGCDRRRVARPDQDIAPLIHGEALALDKFVLQIV